MVQENIGLELFCGQPLWPSRPNPNAHPAGRAHFLSSLPCAGPSRSHQGEGDKSSPPRLHFLVKGEEIYMILTLQIGPLLFPALNSPKDSHIAPKHPWPLPPSSSPPLAPLYLMFQHFLLFHISMPCSPCFLHWESPLLLPTWLIPMQSSLIPFSWSFTPPHHGSLIIRTWAVRDMTGHGLNGKNLDIGVAWM